MKNEIGALSNKIQGALNRIEMLQEEFENYKKQSQTEINDYRNSTIKHINSIIEKQTHKHLCLYTQKVKDEIEKDMGLVKDDLEKTAEQIFEKSEFIKGLEKQLITIINEEIRVAVKNADLHKFVSGILQQYIRDNLKGLVSEIVRDLVGSINRKLTKDYQVAKDITYSINAEIKHTLMKAPISASSEELIKKKIMLVLEKVPIKDKMIEDKSDL